MKLSVSLPEDDVLFLDGYARERGAGSRSAAVHDAVGDLLLHSVQGLVGVLPAVPNHRP